VSATNARIVVIGPRVVDFLPLWRVGRPPAVAVVGEHGPEAAALAGGGTSLVALEERLGRRRLWSSALIDELLPLLRDVLAEPSARAAQTTLVPYAASEALEAAASQWPAARIVGPAARLRRLLDEKPRVRAELGRRGVPVVDGAIVDLSSVGFPELRRRFGCPVVVQRPTGSTGIGTHFVGDDRTLARALRDCGSMLLVSPYVGTCTVNVHALVQAGTVLVGPPSVQLAGLPAAGVPAPIYCGNDFGAAARLGPELLRQIEETARRAASWLAELGYEGIFGVDVVTDGSSAGLLELNPRLQGSTWLLGEVEHRAGEVPMLVRAVLQDTRDLPTAGRERLAAGGGAQLILRAPPCGAHRGPVLGLPAAGAYTLGDGRLRFLRPARGLADCRVEEIFVGGLASVPRSAVDPLGVVARVASWRRLIEPDGRTLTPFAAAIVRSFTAPRRVR
jgi:ATP-grasp domain